MLSERMKKPQERWMAKKRIMDARNAASREITANSHGGGFAAGLASEGYAGGYRDALDDVILVLNRVKPNRRGYWDGD